MTRDHLGITTFFLGLFAQNPCRDKRLNHSFINVFLPFLSLFHTKKHSIAIDIRLHLVS